jgi:hypothetical protein
MTQGSNKGETILRREKKEDHWESRKKRQWNRLEVTISTKGLGMDWKRT